MEELLCKVFSVHMCPNWLVVSFVGDSHPHVTTHSHAPPFSVGLFMCRESPEIGQERPTQLVTFFNAWNRAYLLTVSHKKSF